MTEKFSKAMLLILICFALTVSGYGQSSSTEQGGNSDSQRTPAPSTGADQNQSTPAHSNAGQTAKAVEYNMAQVDLAKMASSKAQNPRVKDFADTMASDNNDALMKLSSLPGGNSTGMKLNAKHQQLMDQLSKLSGAQFDQAYMKAMVTDQQEHVKFLEHQSGQATSSSANGKDMASVAKELLPTARQNLQKAEEIQKELAGTPTTKSNEPGTRSKPTPDSQDQPKSQNQPDSQDQK